MMTRVGTRAQSRIHRISILAPWRKGRRPVLPDYVVVRKLEASPPLVGCAPLWKMVLSAVWGLVVLGLLICGTTEYRKSRSSLGASDRNVR